ncbi:MAG: hypothetical protein M3139_07510 [Bacteroidota bacterium]|nr:hypothetical protein [Bacteroidota bacterium]
MMKTLLAGIFIWCCGSGCFQKVQYIGRNYEPTTNVEMFFSPVDVGKNYVIIGKVVSQSLSLKHTQKKFVETAKQKGADAIIIYVPGNGLNDAARNSIITSTNTALNGPNVGASSTVTTIADSPAGNLYGELIKYK